MFVIVVQRLYTVYLRLIWKGRCGLPIRVNWTFSLGVTTEALRANIDWKLAFFKFRIRQFRPTFYVVGDIQVTGSAAA